MAKYRSQKIATFGAVEIQSKITLEPLFLQIITNQSPVTVLSDYNATVTFYNKQLYAY